MIATLPDPTPSSLLRLDCRLEMQKKAVNRNMKAMLRTATFFRIWFLLIGQITGSTPVLLSTEQGRSSVGSAYENDATWKRKGVQVIHVEDVKTDNLTNRQLF